MTNKIDKNIKLLFYVLMSGLLLASIIYGIISSGENLKQLLFIDGGGLYPDYSADTFMDFFNPIFHTAGANPYVAVDRIYPALPYLLYYFISLFLPRELTLVSGKAISISQGGQFALMVYVVITTLALFIIIWKLYQAKDKEKVLGIFLILMSAPFLFQFERANIIIVALMFLMMFFIFKDSNNKMLREIALICLAISACIKIYPAIFGLILLKEKRFKESLRCMLYGIVIFIIPFFFMGGLDKIQVMLNSLTTGAKETTSVVRGLGYKVNLSNTLTIIGGLMGHLSVKVTAIGNILSYIALVISIVSVFVLKSKWKTVALLSTLIIAIPGFSFTYSLIFMVIPLIMFLSSKEERIKTDYIYVTLFIGIFGMFVFGKIPFLINLGGPLYVSLSSFIESLCIMLMLGFLNLAGINDLVKRIRR